MQQAMSGPQGRRVGRHHLVSWYVRELIMHLQSALQALEDDAFLAKVRDHFPPPSTGTPAEREVVWLRARVAELEASRAELASRVEAQQAPAWKRGASSKFAPGTVEEPPTAASLDARQKDEQHGLVWLMYVM